MLDLICFRVGCKKLVMVVEGRVEVLGRLTVVWERMEEHLEASAANRALHASTYRRLHRCLDQWAALWREQVLLARRARALPGALPRQLAWMRAKVHGEMVEEVEERVGRLKEELLHLERDRLVLEEEGERLRRWEKELDKEDQKYQVDMEEGDTKDTVVEEEVNSVQM